MAWRGKPLANASPGATGHAGPAGPDKFSLHNGIVISVQSGDITKMAGAVLVVGENDVLSGKGAVAKAVIRAGGDPYRLGRDALKRQIQKEGCEHRVYRCLAGPCLQFFDVFHAMTTYRGLDFSYWGTHLENLFQSIGVTADDVMHSNVFTPLLGAGMARGTVDVSLQAAVNGLSRFTPKYLKEVIIVEFDPKKAAEIRGKLRQILSQNVPRQQGEWGESGRGTDENFPGNPNESARGRSAGGQAVTNQPQTWPTESGGGYMSQGAWYNNSGQTEQGGRERGQPSSHHRASTSSPQQHGGNPQASPTDIPQATLFNIEDEFDNFFDGRQNQNPNQNYIFNNSSAKDTSAPSGSTNQFNREATSQNVCRGRGLLVQMNKDGSPSHGVGRGSRPGENSSNLFDEGSWVDEHFGNGGRTQGPNQSSSNRNSRSKRESEQKSIGKNRGGGNQDPGRDGPGGQGREGGSPEAGRGATLGAADNDEGRRPGGKDNKDGRSGRGSGGAPESGNRGVTKEGRDPILAKNASPRGGAGVGFGGGDFSALGFGRGRRSEASNTKGPETGENFGSKKTTSNPSGSPGAGGDTGRDRHGKGSRPSPPLQDVGSDGRAVKNREATGSVREGGQGKGGDDRSATGTGGRGLDDPRKDGACGGSVGSGGGNRSKATRDGQTSREDGRDVEGQTATTLRKQDGSTTTTSSARNSSLDATEGTRKKGTGGDGQGSQGGGKSFDERDADDRCGANVREGKGDNPPPIPASPIRKPSSFSTVTLRQGQRETGADEGSESAKEETEPRKVKQRPTPANTSSVLAGSSMQTPRGTGGDDILPGERSAEDEVWENTHCDQATESYPATPTGNEKFECRHGLEHDDLNNGRPRAGAGHSEEQEASINCPQPETAPSTDQQDKTGILDQRSNAADGGSRKGNAEDTSEEISFRCLGLGKKIVEQQTSVDAVEEGEKDSPVPANQAQMKSKALKDGGPEVSGTLQEERPPSTPGDDTEYLKEVIIVEFDPNKATEIRGKLREILSQNVQRQQGEWGESGRGTGGNFPGNPNESARGHSAGGQAVTNQPQTWPTGSGEGSMRQGAWYNSGQTEQGGAGERGQPSSHHRAPTSSPQQHGGNPQASPTDISQATLVNIEDEFDSYFDGRQNQNPNQNYIFNNSSAKDTSAPSGSTNQFNREATSQNAGRGRGLLVQMNKDGSPTDGTVGRGPRPGENSSNLFDEGSWVDEHFGDGARTQGPNQSSSNRNSRSKTESEQTSAGKNRGGGNQDPGRDGPGGQGREGGSPEAGRVATLGAAGDGEGRRPGGKDNKEGGSGRGSGEKDNKDGGSGRGSGGAPESGNRGVTKEGRDPVLAKNASPRGGAGVGSGGGDIFALGFGRGRGTEASNTKGPETGENFGSKKTTSNPSGSPGAGGDTGRDRHGKGSRPSPPLQDVGSDGRDVQNREATGSGRGGGQGKGGDDRSATGTGGRGLDDPRKDGAGRGSTGSGGENRSNATRDGQTSREDGRDVEGQTATTLRKQDGSTTTTSSTRNSSLDATEGTRKKGTGGDGQGSQDGCTTTTSSTRNSSLDATEGTRKKGTGGDGQGSQDGCTTTTSSTRNSSLDATEGTRKKGTGGDGQGSQDGCTTTTSSTRNSSLDATEGTRKKGTGGDGQGSQGGGKSFHERGADDRRGADVREGKGDTPPPMHTSPIIKPPSFTVPRHGIRDTDADEGSESAKEETEPRKVKQRPTPANTSSVLAGSSMQTPRGTGGDDILPGERSAEDEVWENTHCDQATESYPATPTGNEKSVCRHGLEHDDLDNGTPRAGAGHSEEQEACINCPQPETAPNTDQQDKTGILDQRSNAADGGSRKGNAEDTSEEISFRCFGLGKKIVEQQTSVDAVEEGEKDSPVPANQAQMKSKALRDGGPEVSGTLQEERPPSTPGGDTDHDADNRFLVKRRNEARVQREDAKTSQPMTATEGFDPPPPPATLATVSTTKGEGQRCQETLQQEIGTMPKGRMYSFILPRIHIEGYEGCSVIVVDYFIPDGHQTPEHPQPGSPYSGCVERAFLPDTGQGRHVLTLLEEAFDRRLTFQVCVQPGGQSLVEWADIPHKTCLRGDRDRGGYPDPDYLGTVQDILREKYSIGYGGLAEGRIENGTGRMDSTSSHVDISLHGSIPDGKMVVSTKPQLQLQGFPDCGTILIEYSFPNGTQGTHHPAPGQPYKGTFRSAYLPDNQEGQRVLDLLKKAFDRKLTFQLVQSGPDQEWEVEFADIPHKTSLRGGPERKGYPDPDYLSDVMGVLANYGVRADFPGEPATAQSEAELHEEDPGISEEARRDNKADEDDTEGGDRNVNNVPEETGEVGKRGDAGCKPPSDVDTLEEPDNGNKLTLASGAEEEHLEKRECMPAERGVVNIEHRREHGVQQDVPVMVWNSSDGTTAADNINKTWTSSNIDGTPSALPTPSPSDERKAPSKQKPPSSRNAAIRNLQASKGEAEKPQSDQATPETLSATENDGPSGKDNTSGQRKREKQTGTPTASGVPTSPVEDPDESLDPEKVTDKTTQPPPKEPGGPEEEEGETNAKHDDPVAGDENQQTERDRPETDSEAGRQEEEENVSRKDREADSEKVGNMPPGKMRYSKQGKIDVPGYRGCGVIIIDYFIPNGEQGAGHPQPGSPYCGCVERAYLPDNQEGRRVLDLLKKAFDRKLTFQLVQSGSDQEWGVEFADTPHKTSLRGGPERSGYPDPEYLSLVGAVLVSLGIE